MQKRGRVCLLMAGVVVAAVLAAIATRSHEPAYAGRSLSQWVIGYSGSIDQGRYTPSQREEAIRAIGTNTLPYLLTWIQYDTPRWKIRVHAALNPALKSVKRSWQLGDTNQRLRADGSVLALILVCPEADAPIAVLSNILNAQETSPDVSNRVANVLRIIDRRSWKDGPLGLDRFYQNSP